MKLNIVQKRKIWFTISGVLVAASIVLVATLGLRFGIDFTGGSLLEIQTASEVSVDEMRSTVEEAGFDDVAIQSTDENGFLIRTKDLTEEDHQNLLSALTTRFEGSEEMRFDSIGPVIGDELRRTALIGVLLTLVLIGFYVAWAFRKVTDPVASWKYGVLTILTAFHDVLITIGAFSVLGYFFSWEVSAAFVAAALTILGYSINDTVVVFDRTRENLLARSADTFEETVEQSIEQTFHRSLNTSVTTLLALLAIFAFGGDSTRPFALALMIGIGVGTYSSLFLASPALVQWELWKK